MFSLSDRGSFMLAVLFYGISMIYSFFLWRKGFREDNRVNYLLLFVAFVFHTIAMALRGFSFERCPVNNLYEATIFVLWTIVASYLVIALWRRLRFLGAFASPVLFVVGVFALMPDLDRQKDFSGGLASLHATLILLGYGAFGLGSVAGLMYVTQERNLKFHKARAIFSLLPPMERLEKVLSRLLMGGLVLLSFGLALAPVLLKQKYNVYFKSDFKLIWSVVVWVAYLILILLHSRFDQSGRRFAWGAIGTFGFILLTFWGANLLSDAHN